MSEQVHQRIIDLLNQGQARYTVLEHAAAGKSTDVSVVRGTKLSEACKALVVRAKKTKKAQERDYFLLCFPSDCKADFSALGDYADVQLASPEIVEQLTGCKVGTVPPFSFHPDLKLLLDPKVLQNDMFWFNAGLLTKSIQLSSTDYVRIVQPELLSITLS